MPDLGQNNSIIANTWYFKVKSKSLTFFKLFPVDQKIDRYVKIFRHPVQHVDARVALAVLVIRKRLPRNVQIKGQPLLRYASLLSDFF